MQLSGSILFAVIIIIINLKILVITTGIKPFILFVTLGSIAVYWPSEIIYAKFAAPSELANVNALWEYASAAFISIILVFFFIMIEFGYRKY
jgi:hypothetical protein